MGVIAQVITVTHNGRDSVSNHQHHDCLLNRLFRRRSKKTSKLRVTGLCAGNSPGTGEFPAQMASNAENVSIWWRHHVILQVSILRASCKIELQWVSQNPTDWFRQWLGAVKQQAINSTSVDQDLRHHLATLGHRGLLNMKTTVTSREHHSASYYRQIYCIFKSVSRPTKIII